MTRQTAIFSTMVTSDSVDRFSQMLTAMARDGVEHLTLGIHSNGGNVQAGIYLYNLLKAMPYEVDTHNIGNVDSIANAIFMAGERRTASSTATFMFHGVGFDLPPGTRLEEKHLKEFLDGIEADHARISDLIAEKTKLSVESCRALFSEQRVRGVKWALEAGIIHKVEEFHMPTNGWVFT